MDNAHTHLILRPADDPAIWSSGASGVALTSVAIAAAGPANIGLRIVGVARMTPVFELVATTVSAQRRTTVETATVAAFQVTLQIPSDAGACILEARHDGDVLDRAAFFPRDVLHRELPQGRTARLRSDRAAFLAGTPDRCIERRSFCQLLKPSPVIWPKPDVGVLPEDEFLPFANIPVSGPWSDWMVLDVRAYRNAFSESLRGVLSDARDREDGGKATLAHLASLREQALRVAIRAVNGRLRERLERATKKKKREPARNHERTTQAMASQLRLPQLPDSVRGVLLTQEGGAYLLTEKKSFDVIEFTPATGFGALNAEFGDLGVLFDDRLRFRPAGLVVGEPLYTLALAPGEEVQVRQSVETKRRALMEEIEDREQESGLTLSSTWSTDVADSITDTRNFQSGMQFNEGVNASGASAGIPIGANAGITASASEAYGLTAQRSAKINRQLSAQAVAKMRRQHKTRIEITDERSNALATTRTVRNANQQRPVSYVFSKVYRCEQVLLERHNARLCLRWVVDDPARMIRERFLKHVNRLDPERLDNYTDIAAPEILQTVKEVRIEMYDLPSDAVGRTRVEDLTGEYWLPSWSGSQDIYGEVTQSLNRIPSSSSSAIASDYSLVGEPIIDFVSMSIRDEGPTRGSEKRRTSTSQEEWSRLEREVKFSLNTESAPGSEKGTLRIRAKAEYNHKPGNRLDGRTFLYGPTSVTVRVTATWAKSSTRELAEKEPITTRRRELLSGLNAERLSVLRDTLAADYSGMVLISALRSATGNIDSNDLHTIRTIFAIDDSIVENIPYWATETGRMAQAQLQDRLQSLSIALPISDFTIDELTASQAIVYLPIREGMEEDALLTTGVTDPEYARELAQQLRTLRAQRFPARRTTTDFDDVAAPTPPTGTPADAEHWNNDWEKPLYTFDVLEAWSELVPTDGVHMDAVLSDSIATDEQRTAALAQAAP